MASIPSTGPRSDADSGRSPADLLPLSTLWFHVLLALGDGPAHGYAIGKEVEARSEGRLKPTTGGLYHALRRLEEEGLVEPAPPPEESGDGRRRYFRLCPFGRHVAHFEAERLHGLVTLARSRELFGDAR